MSQENRTSDPDTALQAVSKSPYNIRGGVTVFFILITVFSLSYLVEFKDTWPVVSYIAVILTFISSYLLFSTLRRSLEHAKLRLAPLELDPAHGSIGGDTAGTITLNHPYRSRDTYKIILSCIRVTKDGPRQRSRVIWQKEGFGYGESAGRKTLIKFRFTVPRDLPPNEQGPRASFQWTLQLQSNLDNTPLDLCYSLPMQQERKLSSLKVSYSDAWAPDHITEDFVEAFIKGDRLFLFYPVQRNRPPAMLNLLTGFIVATASILILFFSLALPDSLSSQFLWFLSLPIGAFVLGIALILRGAYLLNNTLQIEVSPQGILTKRRFWSFTRMHHIDIEELKEIREKSSRGDEPHATYSLLAYTNAGNKVVIGDGIKGTHIVRKIKNLLIDTCRITAIESENRKAS